MQKKVAISNTAVHTTEQLIEALFYAFFPSLPRYRTVFWATFLMPRFSMLFLWGSLFSPSAGASLGIQRTVLICWLTLESVRHLSRKSSCPIPGFPEQYVLSSYAVHFQCCFTSFWLQWWGPKPSVFFLKLIFREKKIHWKAETRACNRYTWLCVKITALSWGFLLVPDY